MGLLGRAGGHVVKQPGAGGSVSGGQKGSSLDLHDELWLEKWSGAHLTEGFFWSESARS